MWGGKGGWSTPKDNRELPRSSKQATQLVVLQGATCLQKSAF